MAAADLMPVATLTGLEIIEITPDRAVAQIKIRSEFCNRAGNASDGLIIAPVDTLATTLTDCNTNFIAPVPEGELARAECTLIHSEQKGMVWQTKITVANGRLAPRDVAARTDVIILSLPSAGALDAVVTGPEGLVASGCSGTVVIETSTLSLDTKRKTLDSLAHAGQILLGVPVSGNGRTGAQRRSRGVRQRRRNSL